MLRNRVAMLGAVLMLTAVAAPLEAQGRRGGGPRGPDVDQQMEQLTEVLGLTEEQVVSVRAVLELQRDKRQEMFAGGPPGDRQAMRAAMMELQEEADAELAEILSEEQMEKFREHRAQNRRRGPGGRGG